MRPVSLVLALATLLCAPLMAHSADKAPDFELQSVDGETVRLGDEVTRQATVLFFWATWCPYCKALMPHLQSIRLEHGDQVKILAIHFRDDDDPAAFIENAGYDFTVLPDGDDVARSYGVWGTPGVIIVDDDLEIVFDLYKLPRQPPLKDENEAGHRKKAAYRAPYWAAEIRKAINRVARPSTVEQGARK